MKFHSYVEIPTKPPMTAAAPPYSSDAPQTPKPSSDRLFSAAPRWPSARRSNPSPPFSPSSSTTSDDDDFPFRRLVSPKPLGIPFSWEDLPGIPKQTAGAGHLLLKTSSDPTAGGYLPLPPAGPNICVQRSHGGGGRRDPFLAALLECSKDVGRDRQGRVWKAGKLNRLIGTASLEQLSCKRTCGVSDSVVFRPRPRRLTYNGGSG